MKKTRCAAEKHFYEIETKIRREKRNLDVENNRLKTENRELRGQVNSQQNEIVRLNSWINRLLEYTELTKEDIEKACQSDKNVAMLGDMVRALSASGFLSQFGY